MPRIGSRSVPSSRPWRRCSNVAARGVRRLLLPAPAKINLFLHILGRRTDGYHTLQTAFQFLDLCDRIELTLRDDGRIHRVDGLDRISAADDLAVRAAVALKHRTGTPLGCDIRVEKQIPVGGGLGGGSSDAATVLLGLNALWNTQRRLTELAELGVSLGADVPVFVHGVAAWAEGVGEQLTPIEPAPADYLLLHPGVAVSTAAVFAHVQLTQDSPSITMADLMCGSSRNDLQLIASAMQPVIGEALAWLADQPGLHTPRMTGSGACVFAAIEAGQHEPCWRAPRGDWRLWRVSAVNRSPLLAALADQCGARPASVVGR